MHARTGEILVASVCTPAFMKASTPCGKPKVALHATAQCLLECAEAKGRLLGCRSESAGIQLVTL